MKLYEGLSEKKFYPVMGTDHRFVFNGYGCISIDARHPASSGCYKKSLQLKLFILL